MTEKANAQPKYKDLSGKTFGKLKVLDYAFTKNGYAYWNCQCECGTIKPVCSGNLLRGAVKTCGKCSKIVPNEIFIKEKYAEMIVYYKKDTKLSVKISLEDVEKVKKRRWWATKKSQNWYFYCSHPTKTPLHRYIMDCPKGLVVDHINTYDHLDNRRTNLRICTQSDNCSNQRINTRNKIGIANITWNKVTKKWRFNKKINGKIVDIQKKDLNELLRARKNFLESAGVYEIA